VQRQEDLGERQNVVGVGDPVLNEALQRLAAEAAMRLTSLVTAGDQIPFDIAEDSGQGASFYRYVPLTGRYVAEREGELRSLPSFGPAGDAVRAAGIADSYLERRGATVPADPDERAATTLVAFIASLWDGCSELALDGPRLQQALLELESETREVHEAEVLIAPVVGLQMPLPALALASDLRVVRADTVEAPLEAMRSEGMQRAAWEPQFLALADQGEGPEGTADALRQLHELISVLRLFKEGSVGLGPYVFAATGAGNWRRIVTGSPAPRPGNYKLSEAEGSELVEFARQLEASPDPEGVLRWAIARFEMGSERPTALEGLSDHLLALGAILEGEGPVGASLAVRASALIAEPGQRVEARQRLERAAELEQALMSGAEFEPSAEDSGTGLGLAIWLEDAMRAILRDAALGTSHAELCAAADDALITAGLEADDGGTEQRGSTAEWEALPEPTTLGEAPTPEPEPLTGVEEAAEESPWAAEESPWADEDVEPREDRLTRMLEPVPQEDEIRVSARTRTAVEEGASPQPAEDPGNELDRRDDEEGPMRNLDWLSEVSREATLEWPVSDRERRPQSRERIDTPRVRHMFPVPENADWPVRELEYDRRAAGRT
jgi:hypothetical protein